MDNYRKEYKDKTILITGGGGCIGSNLTKALLKEDVNKIIILDDFSASYRWNIPEDNRVEVIIGHIQSEFALKEAFKNNPDYVFHLAAHFANQNSVDHPEDDLDTNGRGTMLVLQHALKANVKRLVYASSGCSVYGSQAPLPLKENYVSLHLDTPYQVHKLLGELYCNYFHNYYGLPLTIARYFNVYGEGEVPGRYRNVIPNFIWTAMHGKPLQITGTGEETRDFTYVGDIVDGTLRLGVIEGILGEAFNLSTCKETTVNRIASLINEITDNKAGIEYVGVRDWDKITRRCASYSKARKTLGYNPNTNITDGIINAFRWIANNYSNIEKDIKL